MYIDQYWKSSVKDWIVKRRLIDNDLTEDIENFFQNAFLNTRSPSKSWFGIHNSGISLVIGGIYLAAIQISGEDHGIWLLVEQGHPKVAEIEFRPVRSTRRSEDYLVWSHSANIASIKHFVNNHSLWKSYSIASEKIQLFPIAQDRDSIQLTRNKKRLSEICLPQNFTQVENNFLDAVENSTRSSAEARRKRLLKGPIRPRQIEIKTFIFERNPDVVAEVLARANGYCENCKLPAPFRRRNGTPYLEVHHKKPLSEGGEDTVKNAIALCPNCHRYAHYA